MHFTRLCGLLKAKTVYFPMFLCFDKAKTMYFTGFCGFVKPKPGFGFWWEICKRLIWEIWKRLALAFGNFYLEGWLWLLVFVIGSLALAVAETRLWPFERLQRAGWYWFWLALALCGQNQALAFGGRFAKG